MKIVSAATYLSIVIGIPAFILTSTLWAEGCHGSEPHPDRCCTAGTEYQVPIIHVGDTIKLRETFYRHVEIKNPTALKKFGTDNSAPPMLSFGQPCYAYGGSVLSVVASDTTTNWLMRIKEMPSFINPPQWRVYLRDGSPVTVCPKGALFFLRDYEVIYLHGVDSDAQGEEREKQRSEEVQKQREDEERAHIETLLKGCP